MLLASLQKEQLTLEDNVNHTLFEHHHSVKEVGNSEEHLDGRENVRYWVLKHLRAAPAKNWVRKRRSKHCVVVAVAARPADIVNGFLCERRPTVIQECFREWW